MTAPIDGEIQSLTLNNPTDHWSGGTMVVGGQNIILPRNLLMDLPANRLTLKQLFEQAPAACVSLGQSGLAKGDSCNTSGVGAMVTVAANRTNGGNVIAGDVFIEKGVESVSGAVTYINYDEGYFRLNGNVGDASAGIMVRLNDPSARHTIQSGTGCATGSSNCSADPRFTLDPDNYTSVFVTGYPLCIPSTVARPFPGLASAPVMAAQPSTQAAADGTGDLLCPVTNRTISGGQPVDDSRRMAPIMLGDSITAEGNFETVNGVHFLSSHTTKNAMALTTKLVAGQPDYIFPDEVFIDAPGFQNQRVRSLFIGFSTVAPADVVIWSIHYDPVANAKHEFPLASTVGCDIAAGASTCTGQGIVAGGGDIFRIRHDVDFGVGAKARLNPCAHLRADPRLAGLNICPAGGSAEGNITEMVGILSPLPHEIQARTGRKLADPTLTTLDVSGAVATNGQYLFPFGIGLGGIDIPNFFEINIARTNTAFSFSGIPWNLDRRLSPGGCNGSCESTPQPLDPFPFEGFDPRLQAPANPPFLGFPAGTYGDSNFTANQLSDTRNRMLSFVDASVSRTSNGFVAPAAGNFNGNSSLLAWPPVDPAPITIVPTPNVELVFTVAQGGTNHNPVAVNDAATTAFQTAVVISVLANDTDPDHDVLSVSGVSQGAHGTVSTNGITVRYTPAAGYAGPDSFTYTISDGRGGSASASVSVTVNAQQNFAPVANADSASVAVGSSVTIAVLANDTDANGDALTITGVTQGSRGTVTIVGSSVRYTPNAGPAGTDTFTYAISDGHGGAATGTVNVTVTAAESLAVAAAQFRTTKAEWRINGTSSAEGATVTVRLGSATGPVIGSAAVVAGAWSVRAAGSPIVPTAGSTISVVSTGGATQSFPVTIRN
ncbi:Ig-like domain-containing protein [Polaromonas jejuensis]|uniref:Ig-like domain-containing protein n=1 Tax=Polaromonas jejuensis TaxID=457502 RepID=A0ABW0QBG5_9BURK|nr:Ig-like domain-containing protein [Polaromonas jejuensis]